MATVERKFDDLEPAFVELYERCRNDSQWFVDVRFNREHVSPILRVSTGRFDCLHTLPVDKFREQEDFFNRIGLKTTLNTSINKNDSHVGFSRDDVGSLVAEGDVLTPEDAAEITRKFLSEVHGVHEEDLQMHLVYEGHKNKKYNFNDVVSSLAVRRTYILISLITILIWLPLLALVADGFDTISFNPASLFITANSFVGYAGFVIALAVGVGIGTGTLHWQLSDAAANKLDFTPFDTAISTVKNSTLIGVGVGTIGGMMFVLFNTPFFMGLTSICVGIICLTRVTSNFEPHFQTYLDRCNDAHDKYEAAKYRRKILMDASPPEIDVNVDVEGCELNVANGPEPTLECLDRVHSEFTLIGKNINQYRTATQKYDNLKEFQSKLKRQAQLYNAVDVNIPIRTYQVENEEVDNYLNYLESVQTKLVNLEETIKDWEQAKQNYEDIQEYQNILQQRAESFSEINIDVEVMPYTDAKKVSDYLDHLESTQTELVNLEETIKDWEQAKQNYEAIQQDQNVLQQRAESFSEINIDVEVIPYTDAKKVCDYLNHLEFIRNKLKDNQDKIDRHERYRDAESQATDLHYRIRRCNQKYPDLPFDALESATNVDFSIETVEEFENNLCDIKKILQHATLILSFLDTVDHNHPSVDQTVWLDAVETALRECYPNIIRPIANDIAAMKNGVWEHEDLEKYTWSEFEELIGSYYRSKEYEVEVTQNSRDGGVDVWATNEDEIIAIQVKHYHAGNVGRPTLQKLVSFLAKGDADRVVVVTSADFTDSAIKYANDFGEGLDLVSGEGIVNLLTRSQLPPPS